MEWRIVLAILLLIGLTALVLNMAYKVIPKGMDLSQPTTVNVRYSATGILERVPNSPSAEDISGNVWKWSY
jgi:hypothetical protein